MIGRVMECGMNVTPMSPLRHGYKVNFAVSSRLVQGQYMMQRKTSMVALLPVLH